MKDFNRETVFKDSKHLGKPLLVINIIYRDTLNPKGLTLIDISSIILY